MGDEADEIAALAYMMPDDWFNDWPLDEWGDLDEDQPFFSIGRSPVPSDMWKPRGARPIKIASLDTDHLLNILNLIKRFSKEREVGTERWANLKAEGKRRGLEYLVDVRRWRSSPKNDFAPVEKCV